MSVPRRNPQKWIDQVKEITMRLVDNRSYKIFLFGSRAKRPNNAYGDIDVGLWGNAPVPREILLQLQNAIEASDIPLKVDFVDFSLTSENFNQIALQNAVCWNEPNNS